MLHKTTSIIIQIVIWLALAVFLFVMGLRFNSIQSALLKTSLNVFSLMLLAYINVKILVPKFFTSKRILYYFLSVIILISLYTFIAKKVIFSDAIHVKLSLEHMINGQNIETNAWMLLKLVTIVLSVGVLFVSTVIALIKEIFLQHQQKMEIEIARKTAELKLINTQFSPHFFLNSLNNLYSISKLKPGRTSIFIEKLTSLMQYATYEQMAEKVLLEKEINFIKDYIFFQQEKGDDLFDVNIDFKKADKNRLIEPRLFIPFVENAFKFAYQPNKTMRINICIKTKKDQLTFSIENDISTYPRSRKEDGYFGVGLPSVKKILANLYPEKHELMITNTDQRYSVELVLNLRNE